MSFNGHTKILNNGMPSALSVKKGGSVVDSVTNSLGDISTSVMDTTSNISNTLQGQFSRFMNNPLFATENKEDKIMGTTTTGNGVLNTNVAPSSVPTLNGGGKKKKQKNTRKRKVNKNNENKAIKQRKRKAKKTIKRRRKSSHKNKRLISK